LNEKCEISISERNHLVKDNKRLNSKINSLHNSIDVLEANENTSNNFRHPWSKAHGLGREFPKPDAHPLKELHNLMFTGDILNHTYSDTPVSPLSSHHGTSKSINL